MMPTKPSTPPFDVATDRSGGGSYDSVPHVPFVCTRDVLVRPAVATSALRSHTRGSPPATPRHPRRRSVRSPTVRSAAPDDAHDALIPTEEPAIASPRLGATYRRFVSAQGVPASR